MRRLIILLLLVLLAGGVRAISPIEELQTEIDKLSASLEMSRRATTPLEAELARLREKLASIQAGIDKAKADLRSLEISISEREKEFGQNYVLLAERALSFYKASRQQPNLFILFSNGPSAGAMRDLFYRRVATDRDKNAIAEISINLIKLEADKKKAQGDKMALDALQVKVDKEAKFFEGEISGAKAYQSKLSQQIAQLSAKQQELLAAKFASMPVPLLAYTSLGGCSSDIGKSPNFGGSRFGFFSLGVPNRTGMNQYGARGRADSGAGSYEEILRAYYNFDLVDYGTGFNITINGTNEYGQTFNNESMNIEDYLKHLYEMPTNWNEKALKAQAVAARSYALYATNNGQNPIQPNQNGQVVKKEENDDNWKNAVKSTEGKVMVYGGSPIGAWYSSTHGGFVLTSGEVGWNDKPWTKHAVDAGSAGSLNDLLNSAFDKSSPWFYCDWGYRGEYNNTAWLKEEEVVDIVNAYLLWDKDNNNIVHLSQTDKGAPDTWSAEQVKQELGSSAINSISSIEVLWDGSGISKTIKVNGRDFSAQKFKNLFNIRAPGNIQIKPTCQPDSSLNCSKMYGLYNIVRE